MALGGVSTVTVVVFVATAASLFLSVSGNANDFLGAPGVVNADFAPLDDDKETFQQQWEYLQEQKAKKAAAKTKEKRDESNGMATDRVVNGFQVPQVDQPWYTRMIFGNTRFGFGYNCGGSLIARRFVLTAAHCVTDPRTFELDELNNWGVNVGFYCRNRDNCGRPFDIIEAEEYILHPTFGEFGILYDLALVKLTEPVTFVQPAFPDFDGRIYNSLVAGQTLKVVGMGQLDDNENSPFALQGKYVNFVPTADCIRLWRSQFLDAVVCTAAGPNYDGGTCFGDSGGPMMLERGGPRGEDALVGAVSFSGTSCEVKTVPDVMASLHSSTDWIRTTVCGGSLAGEEPYWCTVQLPSPSVRPTLSPHNPTRAPSRKPTLNPSSEPTSRPSTPKTDPPTLSPFVAEVMETASPMASPTVAPTLSPMAAPTLLPTSAPSVEIAQDNNDDEPLPVACLQMDRFIFNPINANSKNCKWLTKKPGKAEKRLNTFCLSQLTDAAVCCAACDTAEMRHRRQQQQKRKLRQAHLLQRQTKTRV